MFSIKLGQLARGGTLAGWGMTALWDTLCFPGPTVRHNPVRVQTAARLFVFLVGEQLHCVPLTLCILPLLLLLLIFSLLLLC